ncbi:hypothetical protein [Cohnella yongneupensis]|uniref:Uncharacterized protein n=1 Tax=Cohnella yongneupensis TaxID=425006 RepID=A0ABW0R2D5_9BACL
MMKIGSKLLCISALSCIAMLRNGDIAEAGLPKIPTERVLADGNELQNRSGLLHPITGIATLTTEIAGNLGEITDTALNMLEQTVDTTTETPEIIAGGVAELLSADELLLSPDGLATGLETVASTLDDVRSPVTNTVGTVVNGTTDIVSQVGDVLEETVSTVVQVHISPKPSAVAPEDEECAENPCLQLESPRPQEAPMTPDQPLPADEYATETATEPAPEVDADIKNTGHAAADGPESRAVTTKDDPSPLSDNLILGVVLINATNLQMLSTSGHGSLSYAKHTDAIMTEIAAMQMTGRKVYAKNTKQLITKRGNEPPTPPPRHSFFS